MLCRVKDAEFKTELMDLIRRLKKTSTDLSSPKKVYNYIAQTIQVQSNVINPSSHDSELCRPTHYYIIIVCLCAYYVPTKGYLT